MNLKHLFAIGLLIAPLGAPAAEDAKVLLPLVTTKPESGCYQLVDIVDEAGKKSETAAPGQTIRIRSRFVNLTQDKFFLAERTLGPWMVQIEYFCRDFESWKNALGHDHPFAIQDVFESLEGRLHEFNSGAMGWTGHDKEWIFLHPSPDDGKFLCGCAAYARSHQHSMAFSLSPLAWDFCVIKYHRMLSVQAAGMNHTVVQKGELEFRIERKKTEPEVTIKTAMERLKNREVVISAPGDRYRITRQNLGEFSDAIKFTNQEIQTVELGSHSWPAVYAISPDGEWMLREQKDRNGSPTISLYRVEMNGRVSEVPAFEETVWAASDKVVEIKRNFGDKYSMGNARWVEDGKRSEITISGKEPTFLEGLTSIVVSYDVAANVATATREKSGE
jgi:uncharacterized protein YjhX (UPF0386 family)